MQGHVVYHAGSCHTTREQSELVLYMAAHGGNVKLHSIRLKCMLILCTMVSVVHRLGRDGTCSIARRAYRSSR